MYTLGIDIGSTATKAVVLKDGKDIAASAIISFGAGTSGTDQALEKVLPGMISTTPSQRVMVAFDSMRPTSRSAS